MNIDRLQHCTAEVVLFQKMTKLADRCLVGHWLTAKIDLRELAHQRRVIQCLFYRRVREAEPLLKKVDTQHVLDAQWTAPIASFGVVRFHQQTQRTPWNDLLHLFQKCRTPGLLAVPLKSSCHR